MTSRIARLVFHERALVAGVIVVGTISVLLGVPFELVLFGATSPVSRSFTGTPCRSP